MDNMLKRIIEVDRNAREHDAEAEVYRKKALALLEDKKNKLKKTAYEDAQKEIDALRARYDESVKEKLSEVESYHAEVYKKYSELDTLRASEWAEKIKENVIRTTS